MKFDRDLIDSFRSLATQAQVAASSLRQEYRERRQCRASKKDGTQCQAWAVWEAAEQLCAGHLYKTRAKALTPEERAQQQGKRNRPTCRCEAYDFPHRPNNGFCRWPEEPKKVWQPDRGRQLLRRIVRRTTRRLKAKGII